jgi:membrane protein DedA with SNARE-associated domain
MTVFAAGRRLGTAIHDPARLRWIPRGALRTSEAWLGRWGLGVVAANRFLSGGRAVIGLLVGASPLRPGPVGAWATVSALLWNALLLGGGYWLGNEWPRVVAGLRAYGRGVTVVLVIVVVIVAVRRWRSRATRQERASAK